MRAIGLTSKKESKVSEKIELFVKVKQTRKYCQRRKRKGCTRCI
jgi:hypothetical protein